MNKEFILDGVWNAYESSKRQLQGSSLIRESKSKSLPMFKNIEIITIWIEFKSTRMGRWEDRYILRGSYSCPWIGVKDIEKKQSVGWKKSKRK